jgi:hypothetical protein
VHVERHFYTGSQGGHYIVVTDVKGKAELIFETDGKTVINYRAGHEPPVRYVEGCS